MANTKSNMPQPEIKSQKSAPMNLSKEEHKNRYLSKFINCLVNDELMNEIYEDASYETELERNLDLLGRLLYFPDVGHESVMFHLATTKAEIEEGVASAVATTCKSKDKSVAFRVEAEAHVENEDYEQAVEAYYKAILYLPWAEWKASLGELLYQQAQCLEQLNNVGKYTSSMVLHLATKCKKNLPLTEEQATGLEEYRNFLETRPKASNKILSNCEKIKVKQVYNSSLGTDRFFVVASTEIAAKEDIFAEKPWVVYHGVLRRHCAACNRTLSKYYLCPCPMCINVSYCDWTCQRSDWNTHKYECRLTAYIGQMPLFLIMLRAYVRSGQNPMTPWDKRVNHIDEFVQKKDIRYALNAFRQMIDQKPPSEKMASLKPSQYYAFMLLAIEFMYVYTASLKNKASIEGQHLPNPGQWQGSLSEMEVVVRLFEDVKRFAGCPYVRFTSSQHEHAKGTRKLNRFIYLISALVPVVRPSCRYNTQLLIRESRLLRATDTIEIDDLLVVAHTLLKKPKKNLPTTNALVL